MHLHDTTLELLAPDGTLLSTHTLPLVDSAPMHEVLARLRDAAGSQSELAPLEDLTLTVGAASTYDALHPDGLVIARDQPLVDYFKQYRRVHGLQPDKQVSTCTLEAPPGQDTTVVAGPARIRLVRTLRVPDDGREYPLPPGLGTFPLVPVRGYAARLPEAIASRGGLLMPMYQSEALWMSFIGSAPCAIKVHAGGVNVVSGRRSSDGEVCAGEQDYVAVPRQPWLDGFCTGGGVVRQFVAAPLGGGYTVAEQLGMPDSANGSIQLDVFPCLSETVSAMDARGRFLPLMSTPHEASASGPITIHTALPAATTLADYKQRVGRIVRVVVDDEMVVPIGLLIHHSSSAWALTVRARPTDTVGDLKARVYAEKLIPPVNQRLVLEGVTLEDGASLFQCEIVEGMLLRLDTTTRRSSGGQERMGFAAGGVIVQKVYEDTRDPALYDEHDVERIFIHTVSSRAWECITGSVPPSDAFTFAQYTKHHLPWYQIYDEGTPAVAPTGTFDSLSSIQHFSSVAPGAIPQNCSAHSTAVTAVPRCGQPVALVVELAQPLFDNQDTAGIPHEHSIRTLLLTEDGVPPFVPCRS